MQPRWIRTRSSHIILASLLFALVAGSLLIRHQTIAPDYARARDMLQSSPFVFTFRYESLSYRLDPPVEAKLRQLLLNHYPDTPPFIAPFLGEAKGEGKSLATLRFLDGSSKCILLIPLYEEHFSIDTERDLAGNRIPCPGLGNLLDIIHNMPHDTLRLK